jgi:MFS family permease
MTTTETARLRGDRDFVRFWGARQVSVAGSLVTMVALPVLVYRLSGSASLTALTTVLEGLPYVLFGLFSGALADRLDRRRVMVVADLLCAATIISVPIAYEVGALTIGHVLVAAFVTQSLFTFFDGGALGALPTLVGRERIGEANAAIWGFGGVLDLSIPMITGVALAVLHPADLLAMDALSFVASALLIRSIRRPLTGDRGHLPPFSARQILTEVGEGVRYLWGHLGVRAMTIIGLLQSVAGAGFMALAVPYVDRLLGIGTSGWRFGMVFSAWGVGGILAAAITPRLLRRHTTGWVTLAFLPVSAIAGITVTLARHWLLATALMIVWGIAYQVVIINSISYRQQVTPEHLLSRVNTAGRMLSFGVGWTGGALVAGALARVLDVGEVMLAMVCAGVVAAAYAWMSGVRTVAAEPGEP